MDQGVDKDSICQACAKNELVFAGPNTTENFCQWLFSGENEGATVIAHNFKGYDSLPILEYLYQNGVKPTIIANGAKNMHIEVPRCRVRMIDSINFLPSALSELPKMLGLEELKKGYFPHLFNWKENQSVVLKHLRNVRYYNPDAMKLKDRKAFLMWYENNYRQRFDFQRELLSLCRSDVDILRRACLTFRQLFLEMTSGDGHGGINPFQKCITIASACYLVFRKKFLRPDTIGIIPLKDTAKKKNIPSKQCNGSNTYQQQKEATYNMLETAGKRKLDLIKWMDITKTRTDRNTYWNLTESSGTDVYTVTMPARSTRSMV
jgi:hypothetical protein